MNKLISVCLVFGFLLLGGCKEKKEPRPTDLLPEDTFTSIMVDVQLTEALKNQQVLSKRNNPEDILAAYHYFLQKQNVSSEEFLKTYEYYQQHPKEMQAVYEKVLDSLNKMNMLYRTDLDLAHDSIFMKTDSTRSTREKIYNPAKVKE